MSTLTEHNSDFLVSSPNEEQEILHNRFQEYGYLFFRDYVDKQQCQNLLTEIVEVTQPYVAFPAETQSWYSKVKNRVRLGRKESTQKYPILCGEPFFETDSIWDEIYPAVQSIENFHNFFHRDDIRELMELVSGGRVFVYPQKMARISVPRMIGYETPPHQDAYSHKAGPTMAGIWIALHDVNQNLGRVKVLARSHKKGVRQIVPADGVGGVQCEIMPDENEWHVSDVRCGDVLVFHSATIHKAEPNLAENKARISIDARFCDYGAPVFVTNIEPHHGWRIDGLGWESIYQNWQSANNQYYWKDYPNVFSKLD